MNLRLSRTKGSPRRESPRCFVQSVRCSYSILAGPGTKKQCESRNSQQQRWRQFGHSYHWRGAKRDSVKKRFPCRPGSVQNPNWGTVFSGEAMSGSPGRRGRDCGGEGVEEAACGCGGIGCWRDVLTAGPPGGRSHPLGGRGAWSGCGEEERRCRAEAVSAFADSLCHRAPKGPSAHAMGILRGGGLLGCQRREELGRVVDHQGRPLKIRLVSCYDTTSSNS